MNDCEWGYSIDNGPSTWAEKFPHASGKRQSPVDIETTRIMHGILTEPLKWTYSPYHTRSIVNPGYCWRVDENGKGSKLTGGPLGCEVYRLEQFHCHWGSTDGVGSEHTVDGKTFSGELHLVHWNASKYNSFDEAKGHSDGLAVLGIFLIVGNEHPELEKVVRLLPYILHKGDKITMTENLDPSALLPEKTGYWTYPGSLTTPPCNESVTWVIFKQPIQVSAEQLAMFRRLKCAEPHCSTSADAEVLNNFRPPLPLGNRELREYGQ